MDDDRLVAQDALRELLEMRVRSGRPDIERLKQIRDRVQVKQVAIGFSSRTVSNEAQGQAWLSTCALVKIAEGGSDASSQYARTIADIQNWLDTLNA